MLAAARDSRETRGRSWRATTRSAQHTCGESRSATTSPRTAATSIPATSSR
jgi:hypothetical protein